MKKGYWIVSYRKVSDEAVVKQYGALAIPAIEAGGGKALIRTTDVEPREAGLKERTVVMEFDSLQRAIDTYNSPAYQAAVKVLGSSVERDFRIVEGVA